MRATTLACDWCHQDISLGDLEDPIEMGWLSVERYDTIKEEIVENDFCSTECLIAYFE